ncbi:putative bifunctional diguanylate cyclase/phosphodiesterase [Rugamonas sp. CCM 8940]|uniref:putative bifunctional diguanylate cyclase/phosphodiesterase n=1 Tax=Rugamonas sp. CCM 8940 TaxID=2765359 RepID=UPI001F417A98|nr:EAL domain-containing protein [Rugamonas sp. CCM 8940]
MPFPTERGFGERNDIADRRVDALARDTILLVRERQMSTRESLVRSREETMDKRDNLAQEREHTLGTRESGVGDHERGMREAERLKRVLESHIVKLRQANEHLVITTVRTQAMAEQIQQARDRMGHMAHHDFLTDLPNRLLLKERLAQAIALAQRKGHRLAVLFIDLDRFKVINDSLGHAVGDQLLQEVGQRLLAAVRGSDTAGRQGGDEFVVLLTEVANERAVSELTDKMCKAIAEPYQLAGQVVHIGATIGISIYPDDGDDADTLIRNADVAMYHGKLDGRDRCSFYRPEMNLRAVERQRTEADLHRALDRGEFELYYQPKVNLHTGAITGSEALLRWTHPEQGAVAPARFIPVAEECGLIVPIGRWVLREACLQAQRWNLAGLRPGSVAVNISALEFRHTDFVAGLRAVLAESGLAPSSLELEITEGVLMRDVNASAAILHELKAIGVMLAIDDFGTGYSSLSYLNQFPIDVLKIDQSFVREIGASGGDGVIVGAVIAMGSSLGQRVVAEGVEEREQLQFLCARQCQEGQGYLFSRPLSAHGFAAFLTRPGAACLHC